MTNTPFVVGRPLRADEPIFGRDETFALVHEALEKFSSVNLVGERRMGKTSFLNHLLDNPARRPPTGSPPLLLARLDLQDDSISDARRFYGQALRALLAQTAGWDGLRQRLAQQAEAEADEFYAWLAECQAQGAGRPVLIVDEFERLLEPDLRGGFPLPQFYDGLRAAITAQRLALLVASRLPLAEHFQRLPAGLTSTFPNYLPPQFLRELQAADADRLLLQGNAAGIGIAEAQAAKHWATGHPCRLQCAGQAWLEAKRFHHDADWARQRYRELSGQACLAHNPKLPWGLRLKRAWAWLCRGPRWLCVDLPCGIGRGVRWFGEKVDQAVAWLVGIGLIFGLLGWARGWFSLEQAKQCLEWIKGWLQ